MDKDNHLSRDQEPPKDVLDDETFLAMMESSYQRADQPQVDEVRKQRIKKKILEQSGLSPSKVTKKPSRIYNWLAVAAAMILAIVVFRSPEDEITFKQGGESTNFSFGLTDQGLLTSSPTQGFILVLQFDGQDFRSLGIFPIAAGQDQSLPNLVLPAKRPDQKICASFSNSRPELEAMLELIGSLTSSTADSCQPW